MTLRRAVRAGVAALSLCLLTMACTSDAGSAPGAGPSHGSASPRGASSPGTTGTAGPPRSPSPTPSVDEAPSTQPLVIATHMTRPPFDVRRSVARRIIDGRMDTWAELGIPGVAGVGPEPGTAPTKLRTVAAPGTPTPVQLQVDSARAAVRTVVRDRNAVAIVPASALGPLVRAVRIDGVHPARRPGAYPLRVELPAETGPVVTMTVTGDVMLARGVADAARRTGAAPAATPALRPMRRRLARADVTIGNLESTLARDGAATQGGDSFGADPRVVRGLRAAGFDALSLANNHLGDFGPTALVKTVRRLRAGGLRTFGAGADPRRARRPVVLRRQGVSFGFVGFNAIGETPEVAPGRPGAVSVSMPPRTGPLDRGELDRFLSDVRRLDRRVDVVTVLPHWGTQYTNRPEPVQRRVARQLVRAGADLVVGGHPHWVQGVEVVDGRLVAHSLGNFVFDMDFMTETMEGLLLELTFWGEELKAAELVPYVLDPETFAPRVVPFERGRGRDVLWRMRATSGLGYRG